MNLWHELVRSWPQVHEGDVIPRGSTVHVITWHSLHCEELKGGCCSCTPHKTAHLQPKFSTEGGT